MKIVCDSCSTKYSISDDKVRGKVFKIRCKKCSHIIVVKGNAEAAAPAAAEAPSDAVWHLVVDGDQVGPLSDADVRERLSRNEITAENYVWKEGFSDWLRLADVPEFADVAGSAAPSTSIGGELFSDSGHTAVADPSPAGGFFGASVAGQEAARASGHSGRNRISAGGDEDAFAAAAASAPASDGADLFGVAPVVARADSGRVRGRSANGTGPVAAGRHDGGRVENLTAQRSENSVLFSLSNLQSLAAPAAAPKPTAAPSTTEGSGLIDIRAMAASTLKSPAGEGSSLFGGGPRAAEDDLPAFGAFSSAAPVLLSIPSQSGPPKWIYALVVLAALMIIAVGVAAFSILGKPVIVEAPVAVPVPVPAAAPAQAAKPSEEKAGAKLNEGDLPPREGGDNAAASGEKAGEKSGEKGKGGGKKGGKGGGKKGGGDAKASAAGGGDTKVAAAAPPAEPDKPKPARGSLDDLLEGALKPRAGGGGAAKPKVEDDSKKPEAAGGGPLQKAAVVAGMNGIKGKISACYQQYKQPGLAMVNVVIAKSGKVSGATVTGKFAGTPTGTCVENAVKSASFPPSDGLSTPYPFTLR